VNKFLGGAVIHIDKRVVMCIMQAYQSMSMKGVFMHPYYTHQPMVKVLGSDPTPSLENLLKLFFENDQQKVCDYIDYHRVLARHPQVDEKMLRPRAGNWLAKNGNLSPFQLVEGYIQANAKGDVSIFNNAGKYTTQYFEQLDKAMALEPEPFGPPGHARRDYYSFNPSVTGFAARVSLFDIAVALQKRWSGESTANHQAVSDYFANHFQTMTDSPSLDPFTLEPNFPGDFSNGASFRELVFQFFADEFGEAKADVFADMFGLALRHQFDSDPHVVLVRREGKDDRAYVTIGYKAAADLAATLEGNITIILASKQ
jgi:hypothetical protein